MGNWYVLVPLKYYELLEFKRDLKKDFLKGIKKKEFI